MDDQKDLKKQAGTVLLENDADKKVKNVEMKVKKIPEPIWHSKGQLYIMKGYKDEMAGMKIPDKMVVRAANGRWLTDLSKK
jgi:hypothetical protein